ncbi:MAG: aldehyde dehydrogenase family protein [Pseudomonadales bacterium]|nr:aldehyde dehydrogenase family protein [Pseudomonadales bacterium]
MPPDILQQISHSAATKNRPLISTPLPSVYNSLDTAIKTDLADFTVYSPIDGAELAQCQMADKKALDEQVALLQQSFKSWRMIPAPQRGELVRKLGLAFRENKDNLAALITMESGKSLAESLGEVQEVIDICDYAVGLSRQLHGLTIVSERPAHRMMEQWHPLGPIGIITAFNFPMAVWAWNATLALVCGNTLLWKPSEKTPLCAFACQQLLNQVCSQFPEFPQPLSSVILGDRDLGQQLAAHKHLPLISATGSVAMGRDVAQIVAKRLARSLLELGGNNALIVTPSANLKLAIRAIVFSAIGTCGQRCTTLRRLIVHSRIENALLSKLIYAYQSIVIGNPLDEKKLMSPLIDESAYNNMQKALQLAKQQGGEILYGGQRITESVPAHGFYVQPAIVKISSNAALLQQEHFAPILFVMTYQSFDEAIALQNQVSQGLSSAVFTDKLQEAEHFLAANGSDCGIANVNIGTSGAEIGGAFGGEKDTGGGRESGSDAWKNYMRRTTNTINYGTDLPLSQGIHF